MIHIIVIHAKIMIGPFFACFKCASATLPLISFTVSGPSPQGWKTVQAYQANIAESLEINVVDCNVNSLNGHEGELLNN